MPALARKTLARESPRRWLSALALAMLMALGVVGCEEQASRETEAPKAALTEQEKGVQSRLDELMQRGRGASLVIRANDGRFCVRFAGSADEELVADLPLEGLGDTQLAAARNAFAKAGATADQLPTRNSDTMFPALKAEFGQDTQAASRLTGQLLREVYLLDPTQALVFETETD